MKRKCATKSMVRRKEDTKTRKEEVQTPWKEVSIKRKKKKKDTKKWWYYCKEKMLLRKEESEKTMRIRN